MTITVDILKAIAPGSKKTNYKHLPGLALWMNHWLPLFDIDTDGELRHFLSQGAHETDSFNALREYATGEAYDTRVDLGNTPEKDGDGQRLKGRGIFMTTGTINYKKATLEWNESYPNRPLDFFANPSLLELPEYAVWSACQYWDQRNFNTFANMSDDARIPYKAKTKKGIVVLLVNPIEYISRKINGGTTGLVERIKFYERAKEVIK